MGTLSLGDTVEGIGIGSGARYRGKLTEFPRPGRKSHRILVTQVNQRVVGAARPGSYASIINVKRVQEKSVAYVKNLVGPRPEPVQEPKFVTPFRSEGRRVIDANGRVVYMIQYGGYAEGQYRSELSMAEAYELARVSAEALTEKYAAKVEDSKSPF